MKDEVKELLGEELKDAYSAEKQARKCMQKAVRSASSPELKAGITAHIEQTQTHIDRVSEAMEMLSVKPGRKVCEAMRGLVEEAQHSIEEHEKGPIMDLVIVAGMQRIEHYEIAAYGTNVALATAIGESNVAALLEQILQEEKDTDQKLTQVTSDSLMAAALGYEKEAGKKALASRRTPATAR